MLLKSVGNVFKSAGISKNHRSDGKTNLFCGELNAIWGRGRIGVCKSVDPPIFVFKSETTIYTQKGKCECHCNFAQIVKNATCLMTTTLYNSNNSLTPGFKCALCAERNNLDELSNTPIKTEERSMVQISFRTQDLNIKTSTIRNPRQNSELIHDPQCFENPQNRSIYGKNPQSVCFLRPNLSIRKPIHPPPIYCLGQTWQKCSRVFSRRVLDVTFGHVIQPEFLAVGFSHPVREDRIFRDSCKQFALFSSGFRQTQ